MASLANVANSQSYGLTGRQYRPPLSLFLASQLPAAREQAAINAQRIQYNKSLAQQEEIADIQQNQAEKATAISAGTNLASIAALTKDSWMPAAKETLGLGTGTGTASPVAEAVGEGVASGTLTPGTAAPTSLSEVAMADAAVPAATETGAVTATETGATTGSSSLASVAGPVAIIAGAELAKGEWGQMDKPWEERNTVGKMTSAPGRSGETFLNEKVVKPILGENNILSKGNDFLAKAEQTVMTPIDMLLGISNAEDGPSWLCSATADAVVLSLREKVSLGRLRKYALENHPRHMKSYLDRGPLLVQAIKDHVPPEVLPQWYTDLKSALIDPAVSLIQKGEMERAYQHYQNVTETLVTLFAPEIRHEDPQDSTRPESKVLEECHAI